MPPPPSLPPGAEALFECILELSVDSFDAATNAGVIQAFARVLDMDPARIRVSSVNAGSTRIFVSVSLPETVDIEQAEEAMSATSLERLQAASGGIEFASIPQSLRTRSPPPPAPSSPPPSSPDSPPPARPPTAAGIVQSAILETALVLTGLGVFSVYLITCYFVARFTKTEAGTALARNILRTAPGILLQVVDLLSDVGFILILNGLKLAGVWIVLLFSCMPPLLPSWAPRASRPTTGCLPAFLAVTQAKPCGQLETMQACFDTSISRSRYCHGSSHLSLASSRGSLHPAAALPRWPATTCPTPRHSCCSTCLGCSRTSHSWPYRQRSSQLPATPRLISSSSLFAWEESPFCSPW